MIDIELTDQQTALATDTVTLKSAARQILLDHGPPTARVSIAIVDDPTIHALNQRYLQHDYPTDVLSFVLDQSADGLEGEVVVSIDTAVDQATEYGTSPQQELLLYVIHGMLHLVGFDDTTDDLRERMRAAERQYLQQFGGAADGAPKSE
jgi:probable rRNA maturation factor